ncbi:hypothetical protein CPB85DRAFT_1254677 [Mucidula mucida]|nr:hypothetical protein CPB85DRAFT_1254677 [Mucidula mucida]
MHTINTGFILLVMALASQAAPLEDKCLSLPQHLRPLYCDRQIISIKRGIATGIEGRKPAIPAMFGLKKGPKGAPHGGTNGGSTHGGGNSGASHGGSGSGGSEGGVGIGGSQGGTSHDGVQGGSDPKPSPQPTLQPTKAADPKTDLPPKPTEAATTAKPADRSRYKPNFDAAGKILSYTLEGTNTVIGVMEFAQMFGGGQESSTTPTASSNAPTPSGTVPTSTEAVNSDDPQNSAPPARRGINEQSQDSQNLERGLFGGPFEWVWDGTKFIDHVIDNKFGEDKGKDNGEGEKEDQGVVGQSG